MAAISKVVIYQCLRYQPDVVSKNIGTSLTATEAIWGKARKGDGPGEDCILAVMPTGAFTTAQVRIALGVLKDGGTPREI